MMNQTHPITRILIVAICALSASGYADDELDRRATWQMADRGQVEQTVRDWLQATELEDGVLETSLKMWDQPPANLDLLQQIVGSASHADARVQAVVDRCKLASSSGDLPEFDVLDNEELPGVVRNNLRLYIGKWLAISGMYNECVETLEPLEVTDVAAPESLLFYRGVAHYRLRSKEDGMKALDRLLENKDDLPRRYSALAELMQAELEQLEPDSLDEISRIMDSVRVRLALGRAGKRVRKEEDEVVEKLDKLIEDLEKKRQQQQQQQQQQGSAKGNRSSSPAEDSSLPSGQASPEVDPRRLAAEHEWGDLPPKEREEALQSLGKEFPSHYREVIEEYFRKIAQDEVQTP